MCGFRDEAPTGVWKGYRSSRLSRQYSVIYQVRKEVVSILVVDVNARNYQEELTMNKPPKYKASDYIPYRGLRRTPGQTIKTLRELHEWSQVELAEKTVISQATISSLETGRTLLGAERAKVIAKAFNIYPGIILFSDWKPEEDAA